MVGHVPIVVVTDLFIVKVPTVARSSPIPGGGNGGCILCRGHASGKTIYRLFRTRRTGKYLRGPVMGNALFHYNM